MAMSTRTLDRPFDVPSEYLPLHKYLDGRYADTVVLTFADIEALLGFALPDSARLQAAWWSSESTEGPPSPQSGAWTHARRTARPRLGAAIVTFERTSP
jgi:hypothetical protein